MFTAATPSIPSFGDKSWKAPARVISIPVLPANTRTGNVLTASANGALPAIDGIALALGDRLVVAGEAAGPNNGLYFVTALGDGTHPWTLTRTADANLARLCVQGASVYVIAGTDYAGTTWTATGTWVLNGSDPLWRSDRASGNNPGVSAGFTVIAPAAPAQGTQLLLIDGNPPGGAFIRAGVPGQVPEWQLDQANGLQLGPGLGGALDTRLSRTAPGVLTLDNDAAGAAILALLATGGVTWAGDTRLHRAAVKQLQLDDTAAGPADLALVTTGGVIWGGDTRAHRSAAKTVQLDDTAGGALTLLDLLGAPVNGKPPVVNVYTASTTWVKPANLLYVVVECVGGGGQAGGSAATIAGQASTGGGGGAGGYARKVLLASAIGSNGTVTVGAGGSTGAAGATGQVGGASSFAATGITTVQGNPGTGGNAPGTSTGTGPWGTGGSGGTASGGDVNATGSDGGVGAVVAGAVVLAGVGGSSALGGIAQGAISSNGGGTPGRQYGGGGGAPATSGAAGVARAGGAGAAGVVIVTEFYGP